MLAIGKIHWAIPEKKNRGVEGMPFPGVLKNSMWDFQGLFKEQLEIP